MAQWIIPLGEESWRFSKWYNTCVLLVKEGWKINFNWEATFKDYWDFDWLFWSTSNIWLSIGNYVEPSDAASEAFRLETCWGCLVRWNSFTNSLWTVAKDWCWPPRDPPKKDNPWKLPLSESWFSSHLKVAKHKSYTILKIASSPLHEELFTEQNKWYLCFISELLKSPYWSEHPVSYIFNIFYF